MWKLRFGEAECLAQGLTAIQGRGCVCAFQMCVLSLQCSLENLRALSPRGLGAAEGLLLALSWRGPGSGMRGSARYFAALVWNEGCGGLGLHSRYRRAFGGSTNQVPGPPAGCAQAGFFLAPVGVRACVCECENLDEVSTPEGALGLVESALGLPAPASWLLSLWGRLSPA